MEVDYWKCPNCGYRISCVQYYSARFNYPCRCGMTLGDFRAVYKRLPTTLAVDLLDSSEKSKSLADKYVGKTFLARKESEKT